MTNSFLNNIFGIKNCSETDTTCKITHNLFLITGFTTLFAYILIILRNLIVKINYVPFDLERLIFISICSFTAFFLHKKGYRVISKLLLIFSLMFFLLYYPLFIHIFSFDVTLLYPIFLLLLGTITQLIFYYDKEKTYYISSLILLLLGMYFTNYIYDYLYPEYSLTNYLDTGYFIIKLAYIVVFIVINYILFFVLQKYKTSLDKVKALSEERNNKNKLLEKQNYDLKEFREEIQIQNEELQTYLEEIRSQRDKIEDKNNDIIESITYASKIQKSLIPQSKILYSFFDDYFILNKPKDILSGDFYWTNKYENKVIVAVADCTGHGVPAALLSVLGISMLNEITLKYTSLSANEILNHLKIGIVTALSHSSTNQNNKDGMDISLIIYDKENKKVEFAGAFNPFVVVRDKEIISIDADRMPIGICEIDKKFTNHTFDIKENDIIYMFTDGFTDQFGGQNNKKIKRRKFKELLINISTLPLTIQKQQLNSFFNNWKGKDEQVDDVLIFGLKV